MMMTTATTYENPPLGFKDIDHARNSVNDFLQGRIQVNKGNKVTATGKIDRAIFQAILEKDVSGVFGYYFRCSKCKNKGDGCLRLKCTARAVGSYEFDDESIQRINEVFRLNDNCRSLSPPIIEHMISSSLFTTGPSSNSSATAIFNVRDEEEAETIVEEFKSQSRLGSSSNNSSSSPDTTSGSSTFEHRFSPPSSPVLTLDSLVYVATPETGVGNIDDNGSVVSGSKHNGGSSSAVSISPSDWGSAFTAIGGKRSLQEATADYEFRLELNNPSIHPATRMRLLTLWEQHGPQSCSIRKPTFSLGRLLAVRQSDRTGVDKPAQITSAPHVDVAVELVVEAGEDLLASELKNLKIADAVPATGTDTNTAAADVSKE